MGSIAVGIGEGIAGDRLGRMNLKDVALTSLVGAVAILAAIAAWNYVTNYTAGTPAPAGAPAAP